MCVLKTGLLSVVRTLTLMVQDSTIYLNWEPPYTLDIADEDPDIRSYCVRIDGGVIFTSATFELLSECGIMETEFQRTVGNLDGCYLYIVSVTAVNRVGNGTQSAVFYRGIEAGMYNSIADAAGNMKFVHIPYRLYRFFSHRKETNSNGGHSNLLNLYGKN